MNERMQSTYTQAEYKPPTKEEFRALLTRWELTGAQAGALAGLKGRQIRRYTAGDAEAPYAVLFTMAMKQEGISITVDRWRAELQMGA